MLKLHAQKIELCVAHANLFNGKCIQNQVPLQYDMWFRDFKNFKFAIPLPRSLILTKLKNQINLTLCTATISLKLYRQDLNADKRIGKFGYF